MTIALQQTEQIQQTSNTTETPCYSSFFHKHLAAQNVCRDERSGVDGPLDGIADQVSPGADHSFEGRTAPCRFPSGRERRQEKEGEESGGPEPAKGSCLFPLCFDSVVFIISHCFDWSLQKAVTAYQMFMKEEMPKIKLNHPQLTQREVLTLCAKEWQKCPPKKKEELDSAASVEKEKYKQNLETYEANLASGNTEQNSPPPVKKANKKVAAEKTQTAASDNKPKPLPTEAVADTDKDAKSHEKKRKKEKKSKKESSNSDGSSKKKKVT